MKHHIAMAMTALFLCLFGLAGRGVVTAAAAAEPRPNIVFILADDMGWHDAGVYGNKFYETPNIDRLARQGIRFTDAYAANPLCSPTRASIQTGLYPGRIGMTTPAGNSPTVLLEAKLAEQGKPDERTVTPMSVTRLKTSYPTLAKALKEAGYATGHYGKWHLGREPYTPLQHGFDVDVPHYAGGQLPGKAAGKLPWTCGYIAPWDFPPALHFEGKPGEHVEDRMAQEAVKFIRANKDRPFYLNYWAFSPHGPLTGKEKLIRKYQANGEGNPARQNAIYAAMIESFDDAVGTLMRTLEELKIADRTIIVFFSDNGGVHYLNDELTKLYGPKGNAPLRAGKATLYEGGTREPCIVVWPGRTKPDSTTDALLSSVDWYPTLLEMVGVKMKEGQKCDGVSQVPAILGTGAPRDTAFCFFPHYGPTGNTPPGVWVRRGDWKLIRFFFDNTDRTDRFELYDIKHDIGETKNLANRMPEKVKELDALISRHLEDIHPVLPKPNPTYRAVATRASQ